MYDWATGWEGVVVGPLSVTALLVFAVAFIAGLVLAPIGGREQVAAGFRGERQLLDEHWAKHEIDREEYVDRRKALDFSTLII
jgi:hypothetical protein